MFARLALLGVGLAVALAGCGNGAPSPDSPQPAGTLPSSIAKMVCQTKAATEIDEALGETATVTAPTWVNHLYSCDYRYRSGTMVLSVKELSSWPQTLGYFDTLAKVLDEKVPLYNLGQGAFEARDASVAVRKDWKILVVNARGLPERFGAPPTNSTEVALTVATVILGCWRGD